MLFTTLPYAGFFLVAWAVHWLLPRPLRRPWLLAASYFFYAQTFPQYLLLILTLTLINYGFGLLLGWARSQQSSLTRPLLILAISANLGTLAYFKYAGLLAKTVWQVARIFPQTPGSAPVLNILLPLGISFFTFEFIHYVVAVYRGQAPLRNPLDFALFAAFFPTQIAGPIKRIPDWVKQIQHPVKLRDIQADEGLRLILCGLVKKIIVADTLAPLVASGFGRAGHLGQATTWLVIYAFAAQIYCDFSGYTDIGRGCALLLGYSVPENFRSPYQARNPSEFWELWHISLSRWLRDYLFIPLGGSRVPGPRIMLNLLITMALGGLWHGASWHFMLWGVYQGGVLIAYRSWDAATKKEPSLHVALASRHGVLLGRIVTFHLMCLGWVIFRAATLPALRGMLHTALIPSARPSLAGWATLVPPSHALLGVILAIVAGIVIKGWIFAWVTAGVRDWPAIQGKFTILQMRWGPVVRPAIYLALLMLICIWPSPGTQRFIYFQF